MSFTVAEHGRLAQNGEVFLRAFMATLPEGGPSVAQNVASGALTVTFALDAVDARDAVERGVRVFADGVRATELPPTEVLAIESCSIDEDSREHAARREPATV
ncbi:MAG TPA: hypothetical protein VNB64_13735 [Solirubrobacteraceae bacterium]|nr:hypothetical protein [Solirubrobacteraceae bacterium]